MKMKKYWNEKILSSCHKKSNEIDWSTSRVFYFYEKKSNIKGNEKEQKKNTFFQASSKKSIIKILFFSVACLLIHSAL